MRAFDRTRISALALAVAVAAAPAAAQDKLTFGLPGVPPVFGATVAYVAQDAGIFKKYGLDVTLRQMDSGAAAANAVDSGSMDVSLSPSPFIMVMKSNAGSTLRAIWGMDNPDWLITSMDGSKTTCDSMKGQGVGVDSNRGARWIQLNIFLTRVCKLETDKDVPTVPLSTNVLTAMASGQITFGVLHMDDVPVIERLSKKKVHTIAEMEKVSPGEHYLVMVARQDRLEKNRDTYVRLVAAIRDAVAYMRDAKNLEAVAKSAGPTMRELPDATSAVKAYNAMEFWPNGHPGLTQKRLETSIASQVRAGKATEGRSGIKPDRTPVTYDQFVDLSIWRDAEKVKR
jgi:ABC-type nitrate/sulfonate/bicarbonate transport system substrate-binding protein